MQWLSHWGKSVSVMVQKVTFEPGFGHPTAWKLCQASSKWVPVLNQGMIRQQKERNGLQI